MKPNRITLHTVEISKLVSKKPDKITLDEVCERLDIPKTSGYDMVTILAQTGMAHVAGEQKQRYTISLTAYRIGINYTSNLDFISTIDPVLKAFSREAGKTVLLGTRTNDAIVHICKFEPENPIIVTVTVGTRNPIYYTSLGKAIMAFTEEGEARRVLERIAFRKHTGRILGVRGEFEKELERMRREGCASDTRKLEEHMECVGTPAFGQNDNVMGAVSVSSLYKSTEDYDALGRQMQAKAAEISGLLEFLGKR